MALTTKRIIALPSQTDPQEGDYLAIDNATSGTHKIPVGRIGVEVDDTLTEAGKAADAKATGDALDEIRSQIEVTGTASGAIATFADGSDAPMKSCTVTIEPQQSGSGTPSPDNVRAISGWTEVKVIVSPTQEATDGTTTPVNLGRTVYGGTLDVVSGSLTVDRAMADLGTLNWNNYSSGVFWTIVNSKAKGVNNIVCSQYETASTAGVGNLQNNQIVGENGGSGVYIKDTRFTTDAAAFKTAMSGVQLCYKLATPQTYQLTPTEVSTLLGENNVWADAGDVEVVYVRDLNITINNLLNNSGTRSLGMMAMSAPTEATAEEPTDEQTEEPTEDDMR